MGKGSAPRNHCQAELAWLGSSFPGGLPVVIVGRESCRGEDGPGWGQVRSGWGCPPSLPSSPAKPFCPASVA